MSQNKHFAVCSLPLFSAFLVCALASAQNYRPAYQNAPPATPAPIIRTQSTAIRPPKRPAPLPKPSPAVPAAAPSLLSAPPEPAKVSLASGKLKVEANNSSLSQILQQIAKAGGMKIEGLQTSGSANPRVFGSYGPGAPLDVLSDLLYGAGYNVVMLGNTRAGTPREMALSLRGPAGVPNQPAARPSPAIQNVENEEQGQSPADTFDSGDTEDAPPPDSGAEPENGQVPPEGVHENVPVTPLPPPGEQQKVKTPQQILQELQNMRLQQEQQQ